jgi:uncharacterized RDD family membrane protein YckC
MLVRKWIAFLMDEIIGLSPIFICFTLFKHPIHLPKGPGGFGGLFLLFLPCSIYSILMEQFFSGQTLGKMLFRVRVIKTNGSALRFLDSIKRHVFDFIELYFLPFVSLIVSGLNRDGKRIGDLLAGTQVVDVKQRRLKIDKG